MFTYAVVVVATYGLTSFCQAFFHRWLGHTPTGRWLFHNHVRFHHAQYRKTLTTPRYLDEERSNTGVYIVVLALQTALACALFPPDVVAVCVVTMLATYVVHIYVHVQFHITGSWLERFHWFLRLQRLHGVHHLDVSRNHAILVPAWDRVLGTYRSAEPRPVTAKPTPRAPRASLVTGNLADLDRDKLGFAVACERRFGAIVQLRLWHQPVFLVFDPALIGEVLVTKHRNFTKALLVKDLALVFGRGIGAAEHDLAMHARKLVQPAFQRARSADVARTSTRRMVERWQDGATVDVHAEVRTLCLEIFAATVLGVTLDPAEQRVVGDALAELQEAFRTFTCLPRPHLGLRRAFRRLDGLVAELVRRHPGSDDALGLLLAARAGGDPLITARQIRDEVVTLFLTGYETVASVIHFALAMLAEHPCDDLDSVIKETLRLFPPGYQIGRVTIEPCELGGHAIPAKTHVIIYPWAVHRSPRHFAEPDAFRPERWVDGSLAALPKFAYLPYGAGPHTCIGAMLARTELATILATITEHVRLTLPPGARVVPDPTLTLTVAGRSLPMVVSRRC